jgi:hypothetical protein
MPRPKGAKNLPRSVQRAVALDALRGVPTSRIMAEHGVSKARVYRLRDEATEDPEGALEEAREELEFRREVYELTEG